MIDGQVIIIGMDGATLDLIEPLVGEQRLPNFAKFMREGAYGRLQSAIPPNTPTAWTSFMTGTNPGKHGIFDFVTREPDSYRFTPVNSTYRKVKPIWTLVSEAGGKVGVINVPMTYPPDKTNGFVISGMDTPETAAVYMYPQELRDEIEGRFGRYSIEPPYFSHDEVHTLEFVQEIRKLIDQRSKVALHLLNNHLWNLFVVVFVSPDRVQHNFWKYIDPKHPDYHSSKRNDFKSVIFDVYARLDAFLGKVIEQFGNDANIVIMSDHGAGPCYKIIDMNQWLMSKGYLVPKEGVERRKRNVVAKVATYILRKTELVPQSFRRRLKSLYRSRRRSLFSDSLEQFFDLKRTRAYAVGGAGNIRINLTGREPQGIIEQGKDYENIREMLFRQLKELSDPETGKRVVRAVHRREDVYSGDQLDSMPDLIISCEEGYRCAGNLKGLDVQSHYNMIFRKDFWSSDHRMDGTLMLCGPFLKRGCNIEGARIVDIAPTALYLLGIPIPKMMDGKVLTSAIKEDYLRQQPIRFLDSDQKEEDRGKETSDYSREDAEKIEERLRSLGYIE